MERLNGYRTDGMRRLIMSWAKQTGVNELSRLLIETRCRIAEEWEGYPKGLKLALVVFDDLHLGYSESEISVRHRVCRERIRQVHERLFTLKCMKELRRKLRGIESE